MRINDTALDGVKLIEVDRFEDERGWFMELSNVERYRTAGLPITLAQENVSYSRRGVLRGMHFQTPHPQGKLITVLKGTVFDAAVDVRVGSPAFGRWFGCELSSENRLQLWLPEGFAHGFLTLSAEAIVHYNCTVVYDAASDHALSWNDPAVGIEWPREPTIVSDKDRAAPGLHDLVHQIGALPTFR